MPIFCVDQELIDRYVQEGLHRQEFLLEKIEGHPNVSIADMTSDDYFIQKRDYMLNHMAHSLNKLDTVLVRLSVLETKIESKIMSKPGYRDSMAIGVASSAAARGIGVVFPHVVKAIGEIWGSVRDSTKS